MTADSTSPRHRPIRSFVLRQGRMSPAQQRALDALLPRFGVPFAAAAARLRRRLRPPRAARARNRLRHGRDDGGDRAGAAGRRLPRHRSARSRRRRLLKRVDEHGLANVRVIQHDAVEVVGAMIPHDVARRRPRVLSRSLAEEAPPQAAAAEAGIRARARAAARAGRLPARRDRLGRLRAGDPRDARGRAAAREHGAADSRRDRPIAR